MKISANGIEMAYSLTGPESAPVVTLSHSLATDQSMWEDQAAALEDRYRVLRYDTRGHGASGIGEAPYTLELLAHDALALLDALGIERTHFVGLSLGGMIGQTLALMRPERLFSLTLCDTACRMPPDTTGLWEERIRTAESAGLEPLVDGTIARWFTAPFVEDRADVVEFARAMFRATPPHGYAGCIRAIGALDTRERLAEIRLPVLIIVGADDPATPVALSEDMHRRIAHSRLEVLPSAAHLSNLEQPEAFNRALGAFLDGL